MDKALLENQSQMMLGEMMFITNLCVNKHVIPEKCTADDIEEISGNVSLIFIALVFAELKHLNAFDYYDALTSAFQEALPTLFGVPSGEEAEVLTTVRYYEKRLFDQDTGEIREPTIWGIFEEINKRAREYAFGPGNCHPEDIQKAILDHIRLTRESLKNDRPSEPVN